MRHLQLTRCESCDQGTRGELSDADTLRHVCYTLELPWRHNLHGLSCIPSGEYHVVMRGSDHFGPVYCLQDVPNRSGILMHAGNFAGDVQKGFLSHVLGCILLGDTFGEIDHQLAILNSKNTRKKFEATMGGYPFDLTITSPWDHK